MTHPMTRCLTAVTGVALALSPLAFISSPARADVGDKVKMMTAPKDSKEFAMKVAEGGMLEVKLGQLAEQKAQTADAKQLAQHIVQDHTKANEQLMALAKQKSITLPTGLMGEAGETYEAFERLDKAEGRNYDRAYAAIVKDHLEDMVDDFREERQEKRPAAVGRLAKEELPVLRDLLERARRVEKQAEKD